MMDVCRAGELLARAASRSQLSTLQSHSSCAISARALRSASNHHQGLSIRRLSRASFSTTPRQLSPQSPAESSSVRANSSSTSPSINSGVSDSIASLLDSTLDGTKGTPVSHSTRQSRFASPRAQAENRKPVSSSVNGSEDDRLQRDNSLMDLINSIAATPARNRASKSTRSQSSIASMLNPNAGPPRLPENEAPLPRMDSTVGRTIKVDEVRNVDVARAFVLLAMSCQRQGVKSMSYQQRFHERPGLKRKRLKIENWRRHFKEQFKGTVELVKKMQRQGW